MSISFAFLKTNFKISSCIVKVGYLTNMFLEKGEVLRRNEES